MYFKSNAKWVGSKRMYVKLNSKWTPNPIQNGCPIEFDTNVKSSSKPASIQVQNGRPSRRPSSNSKLLLPPLQQRPVPTAVRKPPHHCLKAAKPPRPPLRGPQKLLNERTNEQTNKQRNEQNVGSQVRGTSVRTL